MVFRDSYDYEKIPPKITAYNGQIFRSQLEATWAFFFDLTVHRWEYEPGNEGELFRGWLPDFKVWVKPEDEHPIYCEVKPLYLMSVPTEVASKIIKAECRCFGKRDNDIVTAILGKQVPVWCNRLPSLGWISFGKKNDQRKWVALTITDAQVADFRWKFAKARVKKQFTHIEDAAKIALPSLYTSVFKK